MKKIGLLYIAFAFSLIVGIEYLFVQKWYATGAPNIAIRSIFYFLKMLLLFGGLFQLLNVFLNRKLNIGFKTYLIGLIFTGTLAYCLSQSDYYYHILKISKRGWEGKIYQTDDALGYAHQPGFNGFRNVPYLPQIQVQLDNDGNRIYGNEESKFQKDTSILFLGCSFTFGDACATNETFAYQTALKTEFKSINAGVCGYGLTQMFLKAQEAIPQYQPNFTVVQYSPWLVDRAMYPFSPSIVGKVPTPMARIEKDSLVLHPPVFKPLAFQLPIDAFIKGSKTFSQRLRFTFSVGLPLAIHDNFKVGVYRAKEFLGIIKLQDFSNSTPIASAFYSAFQKLCAEQESNMVVLVLGFPYPNEDALTKLLQQDERLMVINADSVLWSALDPPTQENYDKSYKHWSTLNGEAIMVDEHPNAKAHQLIANEIAFCVKSKMRDE